MGHGAVGAILILLTIGLPLVLLTSRLKVGALAAYLLTGAIAAWLGQHYGRDWRILSTVRPETLQPMAEVGATLLLFSLGLELDLPGMRRRLRQVVVSSLVQMGLTLVVGTFAAKALGLDLARSFAVGCCLTMSSTLLVLRALEERRLRNRPEGQTVIGMLLGQDLFLAPLLAILALVLPSRGHPPSPWGMLGAMTVCLGLTVLTRRVLATALLARVRALSLPELEVAFAVIFALGAAFLTESAGLGSAVGAFCAGLALGGDEHRNAIETSTRPLQGLMAIIFFASMGVLFDPDYVGAHPLKVGLALVVCVVVKATLSALALQLAGMTRRTAIGGGIMTAQLGEFSFVLAATAFGHSSDPDDRDLYKLVVSVTCLSLVLTPLLITFSLRFLPRSPLEDVTETGNTIVVAGLGPVGNTVVEALRDQGHPLLLVDRNRHLLRPWEDTPGVRCHLGRIEDMDDWLPAIGHRPSLVVLTFPIADASALVTARLRALDPELIIIARSPYEAQVELLRSAGAQFVICDERETTQALLPMLKMALTLCDADPQRQAPTSHTLLGLPKGPA